MGRRRDEAGACSPCSTGCRFKQEKVQTRQYAYPTCYRRGRRRTSLRNRGADDSKDLIYTSRSYRSTLHLRLNRLRSPSFQTPLTRGVDRALPARGGARVLPDRGGIQALPARGGVKASPARGGARVLPDRGEGTRDRHGQPQCLTIITYI